MHLNCMPEKFSKLFLAILFALIGMGSVVVGVTVLPFIGLIFAVPFFALAYYFYHTHLRNNCEIPS